MTRTNRWSSPKYLIGESYGTTRVSGLASELQNRHWMYLNGVVLVSPTGLGIERDGPVRNALRWPYYAATAWYHGQLNDEFQQKDLADILPEVEEFTIEKLLPALAKGGFVGASEKQAIAERMSLYSSLDVQDILQHNLAVPTSFFWKDLLRKEGYTFPFIMPSITGIQLRFL